MRRTPVSRFRLGPTRIAPTRPILEEYASLARHAAAGAAGVDEQVGDRQGTDRGESPERRKKRGTDAKLRVRKSAWGCIYTATFPCVKGFGKGVWNRGEPCTPWRPSPRHHHGPGSPGSAGERCRAAVVHPDGGRRRILRRAERCPDRSNQPAGPGSRRTISGPPRREQSRRSAKTVSKSAENVPFVSDPTACPATGRERGWRIPNRTASSRGRCGDRER